MPHFPGRDFASSGLKLMLFAAVLRQAHAACLSAVDVALDTRLDAPAQQSEGGDPLPLFR